MPDTTNDIDALLCRIEPLGIRSVVLESVECARYHAALTALVAERDALRIGLDAANAGFAPDGSYTRALVAERDALKQENDALRSRCKAHQDEVLDQVFEMDALRKRVAELEPDFRVAARLLLAERDALRAELAAAQKQRDEARRIVCIRIALDETKHYMGTHGYPCSKGPGAMEIASERGWDCFPQKEGGCA
jgi:hypothetical protein